MNLTLGLGLPPGGRGAAFDPLSLSPFIWLDPSDLSTMFQERTGASATTPSVVDGVVGSMLDKSGNGLHLTAPSDAARPILRNSGSLYWLDYDGVDDELSVAGLSLSQPFSGVFAIQEVSFVNQEVFLGFNEATSFGLRQQTPPTGMDFVSSAGAGTFILDTDTAVDYVLSFVADGASSSLVLDNGTPVTGDVNGDSANTISVGDTFGGAHPDMLFYGLVVFDRLLAAPEIAQLRTYLAAKQGRVL